MATAPPPAAPRAPRRQRAAPSSPSARPLQSPSSTAAARTGEGDRISPLGALRCLAAKRIRVRMDAEREVRVALRALREWREKARLALGAKPRKWAVEALEGLEGVRAAGRGEFTRRAFAAG